MSNMLFSWEVNIENYSSNLNLPIVLILRFIYFKIKWIPVINALIFSHSCSSLFCYYCFLSFFTFLHFYFFTLLFIISSMIIFIIVSCLFNLIISSCIPSQLFNFLFIIFTWLISVEYDVWLQSLPRVVSKMM